MMKRSLTTRVLAMALILAVQSLFLPVSAGQQDAALSGTILSSQERAPLTGAKLHVGNLKTGEIYTSQLTSKDGSFVVENLPAATYELAVELQGGLYVVETPVALAPGQTQVANVAVNDQMAPSPEEAKKKGAPPSGIWNNPLTASLIVISSAVLLGWVIKEATDESVSSPSEP